MSEFDPWTYLARLGVRMRRPEDVFFADGDAVCGMRTCVYMTQEDREDFLHKDYSQFPCPAPECPAVFNQLLDFETHYHTLHDHQCSECHKTLPTAHLLEMHLMENHDSFFAVASMKKKMYECVLAKCAESFWDSYDRRQHCFDAHDFPEHFHFEDISDISLNEAKNSSRGRSSGATPSPRKETNFTKSAMPDNHNHNNAMEVEKQIESHIPRPKPLSHARSTNARPSSLSPKLKPNNKLNFMRNTSSRTPRSKVRPMSALVLSPTNENHKLSNFHEVMKSKIPIASPRKTSVDVPRGRTVPKPESGSAQIKNSSTCSKVEHSPDRKISLSLITQPHSETSSSSISSVSLPKPLDSSDISADIICDNNSNFSQLSEQSEESPRRVSLSLARMGERLSATKPPDLQSLLNNSPRISHTSNSLDDSSTSSSSKSNSQTSTTPTLNSPTKRSRIPLFKRSQSLKLPKQISFGSNVERSFAPNMAHWHSRQDADVSGMKMDISDGNFEVEMRSALTDIQY